MLLVIGEFDPLRNKEILHMIYYSSVLTQSLTGRHALKGPVDSNQSRACNQNHPQATPR